MSYVALYRAYRPESFKEVIGQEHIKRTLQNAIKYNKIGHAYLFSGPRGTGKTTIAKIFAKAVNCTCEGLFDSCNECDNCKEINKGSSDACIEMDAASNNGVDDIREIKDKVKYLPANGKYKVYIIDEVHMLSSSAFNALLKTLEEPPKHIIFILATTEPHKIPATILSRCQRFDFRNISATDIEKRIKIIVEKEKIKISEDAIKLIALSAEGGMRDALSLLDQAINYAGEEITVDDVHMVNGSVSNEIILDLVSSSINKDNIKSLAIIDSLLENGKEISKIISDLIQFYRNILLYKNVKEYNTNLSLYNNPNFIELANKVSNKRVFFYLDILSETMNNIKLSNQKRAYFEMALIKMGDDIELTSVLEHERLKKLEERVLALENNRPLKEKKQVVNIPASAIEEHEIEGTQIERILNNGNKEKKEMMLKAWNNLDEINDPKKMSIATVLKNGSVVAMNDSEMILVYEETSFANIMNKESSKEIVRAIFNTKKEWITDYIAVDKKTWDEIITEFKRQYSSGIKKPHLGNIKINTLDIKPREIKKNKTLVDEAKEMFGEEKIKVK